MVKDLIKVKADPKKHPHTGKMWINIDMSNDAIKFIKSAVQFYEGDTDNKDNQETKEEVRKMIHEIWKQLNPS